MFIKSKSTKPAAQNGTAAPVASAAVSAAAAVAAAAKASLAAKTASAAGAAKFAAAREKHAKQSRDLLSPVQYTTYLSSSIISTFEIRSSAASAGAKKSQKLAVDDDRAQSRRIELLESALVRLQHQHYSREQQDMGLQFTNATSSAVTLGAVRTLLNYVKWNATGASAADGDDDERDDDTGSSSGDEDLKHADVPIRWTFLHGHVKASDMNHEQVREFTLALQCLTRSAVLLGSQRDDPAASKVKALLKQKQDKQGKALQAAMAAVSEGAKQQSAPVAAEEAGAGLTGQAITQELLQVYSALPGRVKYSRAVAESMYDLLRSNGSQLRQKYVDMAEQIATGGLVYLKESIDEAAMPAQAVADGHQAQRDTQSLFASSLALVPRFKQNSDQEQAKLISRLVSSLEYLLELCLELVPDRRAVLRDSLAETLQRRSEQAVSDKQHAVDFKSTLFGDRYKSGFSTLGSYEYMRLYRALSECVSRLVAQETTFTFTLDAASIVACVAKALVLDTSLRATQRPDHPVLMQTFFAVVPFVHQHSLRMLSALMLGCGPLLLPLVNTISDLLIKELKTCASMPFPSLPTLQLYHEVNRCLSVAGTTYGALCAASLFQRALPLLNEHLGRHYQRAFTFMVVEREKKDSILDSFSERLMNKKDKKKRKREQAEQLAREYNISQKEYELVLRSATITLGMMNDMFSTCRVFITSGKQQMEAMQAVADTMLFVLNHLEQWFEQRAKALFTPGLIHPVNEVVPVVDKMFDVLLSSLLAVSAVNTQSPFLAQAVRLFRAGASSRVPQIASKCSLALTVVESHLHPRSAPLYIASADTAHALFLGSVQCKQSGGHAGGASRLASSASLLAVDPRHQFADLSDAESDSDEEMEDVAATQAAQVSRFKAQPAAAAKKDKA